VFVQATDGDGNALGGIRHPLLNAPLATHVGWSLRAAGYGEGDLFTVQGSMIAFAVTEADRQRADDPRPSLAARYASQYGKGPMQFSPEAVSKLVTYPWPGNVRELEGTIHRAVVFSSAPFLDANAIDLPTFGPSKVKTLAAGQKDQIMSEFERSYLMNLLAEHHGNLSRSAVASGKDRRTLQRLLRKHGIERVMFRVS